MSSAVIETVEVLESTWMIAAVQNFNVFLKFKNFSDFH